MTTPRFCTYGENDSRFYTVAFVSGFHVSPSDKLQDKAFFVLSFSPSEDFTRFSVFTFSESGELLSYSRGTDDLDSAEYMMIRSWLEEGIPLHTWRFFPSAAIDPTTFAEDDARSAYESARRRVAHIIFNTRIHQWSKDMIQKEFPYNPAFRLLDSELPDPASDSPENQEIMHYITDKSQAEQS